MSDWEDFCTFADVKVCASKSQGSKTPPADGIRRINTLSNMKIISIIGKMTGKAGNMVTSTVGGSTIAREYNPNVANPNTVAQQTTRSKFKLISQLAATMSPVIAIRRDGLKSARNQFTSINYEKARYNQGQADVNLNVIQLTKSNRSFPGFNADRTGGRAVVVKLNAASAEALSRVVYCMYEKTADTSLRLVGSTTVNNAGGDGMFQGQLAYNTGAVVIYAYGIKDLESGITTKFGNLQAPSAADVAQLLVSSNENMSSVQLTKTAGLTLAVGENQGDSDDVEHFTVSLVTSGNGSATGGGRFEAGQLVTLHATPDVEASFVAWKANNAAGATLSTNPTYSFEAQANVTICAVFQGGPTPKHQVIVSANPEQGGTVSGGGLYDEGSNCTVVAVANSPYAFMGWYENNQLVSNQASYTFPVIGLRNLEARFAQVPTDVITVSANPAEGGTVSGGGSYARGSQATVNAVMNEGYDFVGWYENGSKVSDNLNYSFTVQGARTLEARFEVASPGLIESVSLDSVPLNTNKDGYNGTDNVIGTFDSNANGKTFAIVKSENAPAVGQSVTSLGSDTIANGAAQIAAGSFTDHAHYWPVVGTLSGGNITVEEVWPYWFNCWFNPD